MFRGRKIARKDQRRVEMSFGFARFRFVRDLAGFDFGAQPSVDKAQLRERATGRFIANDEAVLPLSPPGAGKTHPAVALGREAISAAYTVLFVPTMTLVAPLPRRTRRDARRRNSPPFGKPKLLIVDEIGYLPLEPDAANLYGWASIHRIEA